MNREDIIRLAREAGIADSWDLNWQDKIIERFAALVASAKREECAKICDEQMQGKSIWIEGARACSLAIRARGQA